MLAERILSALGRIRGMFLERWLTERTPASRISLSDPRVRVHFQIAPTAKFVLNGTLHLQWHERSCQPIFIRLDAGSTLQIDGDFTIGSGVRLIVSRQGTLRIGGRDLEKSSGVTCDSRIIVKRSVSIGKDFLCSWGVYITDCDWHQITGQNGTMETHIGDHVWVAPNAQILKGSRIGNGAIVATGTVMHKQELPENCLGGGVPFRVLAQDRSWRRELDSLDPGAETNLAYDSKN